LLSISHAARAHASDFSRSAPDARTSLAAIPDSHFAIGDFDGDRQPDLATVGIARVSSLNFRYLISFQLSKGKVQTIGVTGPAGGLVLLARDVNGDRALDLVLATAWRHELVAVLLNDGQGNFSAARPGQFQMNAVSSETQIGVVSRLREDRAVLSFQYSFVTGTRRKTPAARESEPAFSRAGPFAVSSFSSSPSGRAPPAFLHV
jgi:hypothetical protein